MEEITMTTAEIIEVIKGLTVLELNDLVKACEDRIRRRINRSWC